MATLKIEHAVNDFDVWRRAFDADPVRREASGVRRYRVFRPLDDRKYVQIDLDFDDVPKAEAFRVALEQLWGSGRAAPALAGSPRTRIVEQVLSEEY
jgi:hypothetical protein